SQRSMRTVTLFDASIGRVTPMTDAMCPAGPTSRMTPDGPRASTGAVDVNSDSSVSLVWMTPLGWAVVPDVYSTRDGSPGEISGSGRVTGSWRSPSATTSD